MILGDWFLVTLILEFGNTLKDLVSYASQTQILMQREFNLTARQIRFWEDTRSRFFNTHGPSDARRLNLLQSSHLIE